MRVNNSAKDNLRLDLSGLRPKLIWTIVQDQTLECQLNRSQTEVLDLGLTGSVLPDWVLLMVLLLAKDSLTHCLNSRN